MAVDFAGLLAELDAHEKSDAMAKAMKVDPDAGGTVKPAEKDGKKIEAAAKDAGLAPMSVKGKDTPDEDAEQEGTKDGDEMGKSFAVTLADGTEQDVYDATEILKSMGDQVGALATRTEAAEGDLAKALEVNTAMFGQLKAQGEMIKALTGQVQALREQPAGRRTTLVVGEKPGAIDGPAAAPAGMSRPQMLAKSLDCMRAGKLTGSDCSLLESCLNRGVEPPPGILAVLNA